MHVLIWDAHTRMGHNIVLYAYGISHTRMGHPIHVWANIRISGRTYTPCLGIFGYFVHVKKFNGKISLIVELFNNNGLCVCVHCSNVFMYILFTHSFVSDTTTVMFIVFLLFILPSKSCIACRKCPTPSCRRCYQPSITREGEILRYG